MPTMRPAANPDAPLALMRQLCRQYNRNPSLFRLAAEMDESFSWVWRCKEAAKARGWMEEHPTEKPRYTITPNGERVLDLSASQMRLPLPRK